MADGYGYLRRDDDGHWFLVPEEVVADFDRVMELIEGKEYMQDPDAFDEFNSDFSRYRVDGVTDLRVVLSKDD